MDMYQKRKKKKMGKMDRKKNAGEAALERKPWLRGWRTTARKQPTAAQKPQTAAKIQSNQ